MKLKKAQMELETEKILKKKKKNKEKNQNGRINEITSRLTRSIESLQSKIKILEKENKELEAKVHIKKKFKKSSRNPKNLASSFKNNRRNSDNLTSKIYFNHKAQKALLNHSNSSDFLLTRPRQDSKLKNDFRDASVNSKTSIPQLNLSGISQGSPDSTHRILTNRSHTKRSLKRTNTSTNNISFCNSTSGIFKHGVIGAQREGSSKY